QASVQRTMKAAVGDEHFVGVPWIDIDPYVVAGAADEGAIPAHHAPRLAGIVRSPERSLIRGLYQRVHALAIRARDGDVDLSDRRMRQPPPLLLPRRAAVTRHVNGAAGPAAVLGPGVHLDLPRAGEEHVRVACIHRESRTASVLVDEE